MLILREVLDWSAADAAATLGMTVVAATAPFSERAPRWPTTSRPTGSSGLHAPARATGRCWVTARARAYGYRAFAIGVVDVRTGRIGELAMFTQPHLFPRFGMPAAL